MNNKKEGKFNLFRKYLTRKIIILITIILLLIIGIISIQKYFFTESKSTKLGFEDIGELATQAAYCTQINVTDTSRDIFGIKIPFTQSKYIYSYDVEIKAGFDFNDIDWSLKNSSIEINMPEAKIISCNINTDSFKIYHEDESIFRQITLEENNEALKNLKQQAQDDAIANGLLENARNNAETILKGFFSNEYDLDTYEIKFIYK